MTILVVDDDITAASYVALALESAGHEVRSASDGVEALRSIEESLPELVISDLQMPRMDGLELLSMLRQRWPNLPVILATVLQDVPTVVNAMQLGAVNYLVKPIALPVLLAAASKALARSVSANSAELPESGLVGQSAAMLKIRHQLALACKADAHVLIVGETGTGKELIARGIHRLSDLASRPFVAHNSAVTTAEMFDSEFFGHVQGAFTGAQRNRLGLLREADRGILFLDELECLGLVQQAKLLRVLDRGEVRPVGSEKAISVSVRFVAATNRPPEALLRSGELREDFYYRLRGFEFRLPPLAERIDDVELLARHFLSNTGKVLSQGALEALERHDWPGNVRELQSRVRRAAANAPGEVIELSHFEPFPPRRNSMVRSLAPEERPSGMAISNAAADGRTLDELQREAIVQALAANGGVIGRAAKALGIHRSTLHRRAKELGLLPRKR